MAARSPHDRKVLGSNPARSYETVFLRESRIDALTCDNKKVFQHVIINNHEPSIGIVCEPLKG